VPWFASALPGKPAHGFGRNRIWTTDGPFDLPDGSSRAVFRLQDDKESLALWPVPFVFEHEVTLGPVLTLVFRAWNRGTLPVRFETVWHTYFAIEDLSRVQITGLEGCHYHDKNRDRAEGSLSGALVFRGPVDWVFPSVPCEQELSDGDRRVRVWSDAPGAVVWNPGDHDRTIAELGPGAHRHYLCLERGVLDSGARVVEPGGLLEVRMALGYNRSE